jgi:hypothetical protein
MTSQKQILANRRNARSSTGPRTLAGRKRSCRNAIMHGMTAQEIAVIDEKPEDFEMFHRGMIEAHQPANAQEHEIVLLLTIEHWKLRRVIRANSYLFQKEAANVNEARQGVRDAKFLQGMTREAITGIPFDENSISAKVSVGATFSQIIQHDLSQLILEKAQRYQTASERAIFRWMLLLARMQETRRARNARELVVRASGRTVRKKDP